MIFFTHRGADFWTPPHLGISWSTRISHDKLHVIFRDSPPLAFLALGRLANNALHRNARWTLRVIRFEFRFHKVFWSGVGELVPLGSMTPPTIPPMIDAPTSKTVRYSLTRGDIFRWQVYVLIRNRVVIAFGLISSAFIVWSDLHTPEMADKTIGFKIFCAFMLTAFAFFIIGVATMLALFFMVMFKKYRGFLGEHELEIRDDGLVERTDVNESVHRWAGFDKIVTKRRYLYIYVTDHNVHIVPRRYFASEQTERVFRDELERHINAA